MPLGQRFFAGYNPVRTGGPMQVSVEFADAHAKTHAYPYRMVGSIRDEVFSRRGGLYFGIAHLLDYPAQYDQPIYRFADFNAGQYASRNAAFQSALSRLAGVALDLDGDLIAPTGGAAKPGSTEAAARSLGPRLGLSDGEIRRALEQEGRPSLEQTPLCVFELADAAARRPCRAPCCRASAFMARRSRAHSRPSGSRAALKSATSVAGAWGPTQGFEELRSSSRQCAVHRQGRRGVGRHDNATIEQAVRGLIRHGERTRSLPGAAKTSRELIRPVRR